LKLIEAGNIERGTQVLEMLHEYIADMVLHGDVAAVRALGLLWNEPTPGVEHLLTQEPGKNAQKLARRLVPHVACMGVTYDSAARVAQYMFDRRAHHDMHAHQTLKNVEQFLNQQERNG
jgi:hypothetical protein